jgi:Na+-transporting methylmalonyl-CoA/oxaloacetate decarboxylase gamma subunit
MQRNSYGLLMMFLGMGFLFVRIVIHNQMQRVVARLAPPKTNRPLKNLFEAINTSRVRREYQRLFPTRARRKFLVSRITTIVGIVCMLVGIFLA